VSSERRWLLLALFALIGSGLLWLFAADPGQAHPLLSLALLLPLALLAIGQWRAAVTARRRLETCRARHRRRVAELEAQIARLRERELFYRTILEDIPEMICRWKPDGSISYVNEHYSNSLGIPADELMGNNRLSLFHYGQVTRDGRVDPDPYRDRPVVEVEFPVTLADGSVRWQRWVDRALFDEHGEISEFQSVGADVTEQRRIDEALRVSEERLRLAQSGGNVGVWEWDLDSGHCIWTPELEMIYGLAPGSFDSRYETWTQWVHPEDLPEVERKAREFVRAGDRFEDEFRIVWSSGEVRWISARGRKYRDGPGRPERIIGVNVDITERKLAEERALRLAGDNQCLARMALSIQEDERTQLARELHDELGQSLTAIRTEAQTIRRLNDPPNPVIEECADAISTVADQVYGVVSGIMQRLHPALLDDLGLVAALREMVFSRWGSQHPEVALQAGLEEVGELPSRIRLAAYRIVQEALTNVAKHARASRVELRLRLLDTERLELVIRDNGCGLEPQSRHQGYGLLGMRERVLALNGEFELESAPGAGVTIRAELPLTEAAPQEEGR